jgi:hypothetical protein
VNGGAGGGNLRDPAETKFTVGNGAQGFLNIETLVEAAFTA